MTTFSILPEILLVIMEHMDMKELLNACFVSRTWYNAATHTARYQLSRFLTCTQLRSDQVLLDFPQVRSQTQLMYTAPILPEENGLAALRLYIRSSSRSYATLYCAGITPNADQGITFKLKAERERPASVEIGIASIGSNSRLPSLSQLRVDLMSPLFPATLLHLVFCRNHETPTSDLSMSTLTNSTVEDLKLTDMFWWLYYPEMVEVHLPQSVVEGLEVVAHPSIKFDSVQTAKWCLKSLDLDIEVCRRL